MLAHVHPSYSLVCFMVGIVAGDILTLITQKIWINSPLYLILALAMLAVTFFRPIWPMLLLSLAAGMICINYRAGFDLAGQEYFQGLVGETITITGTVSEDPDTSEQRTALRLGNLQLGTAEGETTSNNTRTNNSTDTSNASINSNESSDNKIDSKDSATNTNVPGSIYIQMSPSDKLQRSDIVTFKGKISAGFGTFAAVMYRPTLVNITRPEPGDVFLLVRNWFAGLVKTQLSDEESALGLGYLLGMRSSLPAGLDERLRTVGLTHIIVASGANLSILIGFARKWLGKVSRFTALFFSILLVLGYVGVVGLAPSMTRAGLVSILGLVVWYVGREFRPWRLLLIVGAITLLISPTYLIDLGWLLSFASFAGIMIFGPALTKFFYGDKEPNFLAATLLETISASLLCTPVILYFFGTISLISLAANLMILPTISLAMALTFATGLAYFLPPLATLLGKLASLLLEYHLAVINFFGEQTLFLLEIPAGDARVFLLYLPVVLPFCAKKLYNMYKCRKSPPLQLIPNQRC